MCAQQVVGDGIRELERLDTGTRLECRWCRSQNLPDARSCATCGAPLDVRDVVSDSGWREAPRLRDMTEIHFGQSTCQVEGEIVPVAEISLAQGDWVYFEHHVMLWKDDSVAMSVMRSGVASSERSPGCRSS